MTETLLVIATITQGLAAAAVAIFTWRLVRFTRAYVEEMRVANELQAVANAQQQAHQAGEQALAAPNIACAPGGGKFSGDAGSIRWNVRNIGSSVASSIVLKTPLGDVTVDQPLGPGETQRVELHVRRADLPEKDKAPPVEEIYFADPNGQTWMQSPGGAPRRTEPKP